MSGNLEMPANNVVFWIAGIAFLVAAGVVYASNNINSVRKHIG